MTGFTDVGGVNVRGALARSNRAVVTANTRANHLRVVDLHR